MKTLFFTVTFTLFVLLFSCDCPIKPSYRLVLPELPGHWEEFPGKPHWRLEWINGNAAWQDWEGLEVPEISINQEWTTAVLALPFWPERGLLPGMMRPSGALFPWDVSGETIVLSWKAGVEAFFWKEMVLADRPAAAAENRLPWYFDWPRFRELMESENIPSIVCQNPWLADWKSIAQKTILSGFDRRRIVSRSFSGLAIPGLAGRWIGSSPFTEALETAPGSPLLLMVTDEPDTWVSEGAVLRCSSSGWVYLEH